MLKKLKKLTVLQVTALLLAAALVMVAGGCDKDASVKERDPLVPVAGDFDIGNLSQSAGSVTAVTITPKAGKSNGAIIINYGNSTTPPQAAGSYVVTFDVAADGDWKAATKLFAGTLVVSGEIAINYVSGTDALGWGIATQANVATLGLTPGNDTTEINLNWYSSGPQAGKVTQVRFIRGTFTAGTELIEKKNGTVTPASAGNNAHKVTVTGLRPGSSYQYAVSSNGTDWTNAYDFKVPAATGAFSFAVIADPQLALTAWDNNNRYSPDISGAVTNKTGRGWLDTMEKIVAKNVSFIASCGDQVDVTNNGNEAEYTLFFAPPGLRSLPLSPVPGNHDAHTLYNYHYNWPNPQKFADETVAVEAERNYFYLYNNILFVVLNTAPYPVSYNNTTDPVYSNAQANVDRFDATLTTAKAVHPKYDWLIVQHHKSTASVADHLADVDIEAYVRCGFETVMTKHKVDFVLAGHDHVYARSYPLEGKDDGKVSVPDKTKGTNNNHEFTNPGNPIYMTFTTGSGLKYYQVSSDTQFPYTNTLYVKTNATYPYLGEVTDTQGTSSTYYGSTAYMTDKKLPVSNAVFVQPYIPSYCIAEVSADGKSIKFSTYPIITKSGTDTGAAAPYSFDANTPYDWVQVTKN